MRPTGWLCGVAAAGEPAGLVHLAHATKAAAAWTLQDLHVLSAVDPVELLE
jgi:hypothetical protein